MIISLLLTEYWWLMTPSTLYLLALDAQVMSSFQWTTLFFFFFYTQEWEFFTGLLVSDSVFKRQVGLKLSFKKYIYAVIKYIDLNQYKRMIHLMKRKKSTKIDRECPVAFRFVIVYTGLPVWKTEGLFARSCACLFVFGTYRLLECWKMQN